MTYNLNERILLPPSISDIVIASAIAYFEYNDWDLSAELLMHSFNNEELDSIYLPVNQDIVSEGTFSTAFLIVSITKVKSINRDNV